MNHRRIKELERERKIQIADVFLFPFCCLVLDILCDHCVRVIHGRTNQSLPPLSPLLFGLGGRPSPSPSPSPKTQSVRSTICSTIASSQMVEHQQFGRLPIQCKLVENRGCSSTNAKVICLADSGRREEDLKKRRERKEKVARETEIDRWAFFLLFLFIIILVPSEHRKTQKMRCSPHTHSLTHFSLLANYSSLQQQQQKQRQRMNIKRRRGKKWMQKQQQHQNNQKK